MNESDHDTPPEITAEVVNSTLGYLIKLPCILQGTCRKQFTVILFKPGMIRIIPRGTK